MNKTVVKKELEECFEIVNDLRSEMLDVELESYEENLDSSLEFEQSKWVDSLDEVRTKLDLLIGKLRG